MITDTPPLLRVVRMTFQPERAGDFLAIFEASSPHIRAFEGCRHLELWQDADDPNVFLTYSHWDSPQALENYRHSELFRSTWAKTKPLFADRPVAFSTRRKRLVQPAPAKG